MRSLARLCMLFILATFLVSSIVTEAQDKPDYTPSLNEARRLLGSGDYAGADRALRTLLTTAPELADGYFLLGFALLHEQQATESLAKYMQGAKLRELGAEELIGISLDYIQLKDLPNAEQSLAAAAKRAPDRPLIWYLLGRTQYEQGHGEDAERSFLACLRLDPHHLRAQYNLGRVYEMLKQPEAAAGAYRAAIAWQETTAVKDPEPYFDLGVLLRKQGKFTEAIPFFVVAAEEMSHDPVAYKELALTYEQLGRYDEAATELKAAIALTPHDTALHFFLGRVDRKSGRKDEAAQEFMLAAGYTGQQSNVVGVKH